MAETPLLFKSAVELGRMIRQKHLSSLELAKQYLDALDKRGRELNAVAELTRELALEQAKRADEEVAQKKMRSALHGVPWGAKDLLATKGIPTRWGSPVHKDQVFDFDACVVERLRDAGCVLVAKLAMIELAGGGGYNSAAASLSGPCKNPFDPSRWAGGSSSGSGAAVAAGLVGFAIGTETWGSITVPAAFCNVTGLRPTYGRVPRFGAMALCFTMDKIGPMARTAEDCAVIFEAISGRDPRDPSSNYDGYKFARLHLKERQFRLGVLPTDYQKNEAPVAEQCFNTAMQVFQKLGHTSGEAKLPDFPYNFAAGTIVDVEGAAAFENLIRGTDLELLVDKTQQAGLLAALATPGVDYLRAQRMRTLAGPVAVKVFDQFDALVAPTLLKGALPIDKPFSETWHGLGGNGGFGNLLGWPSISIPMGSDADNLPLALEIIGAPYREDVILELAIQFQSQTDWHRRVPK